MGLFSALPQRGDTIINLKLSPLKNAAQETQGVAIVLDDLTEQREHEETLELMTRYLPPGMVDNIEQIAGLALGGERREMTSMFVYATPYSILSESVRPEQMMELLVSSARDGGAALVIVTHDNLVAAYADREVRLRDGVVQHEVRLS